MHTFNHARILMLVFVFFQLRYLASQAHTGKPLKRPNKQTVHSALPQRTIISLGRKHVDLVVAVQIHQSELLHAHAMERTAHSNLQMDTVSVRLDTFHMTKLTM